MKNHIRDFVLGAGLVALLWSPLLMAQVQETAEIPFDFHAGQSALPAGTYSVIKAASSVLQLRNDDTRDSILLMGVGREAAKEDARLVFNRYGDIYFLSAVWIPDSQGYSFPKTKMEKEMARASQVATTYVALVRR